MPPPANGTFFERVDVNQIRLTYGEKERSRPSGKTQGKPEKLTSVNGRPIADNEDSQTAGLRGPIVLQDPWMLEKLAHFDREVIPERRMHAKGSGAYGTFTVTHDITRYTRASIFSRIGKQTECFVRFSTVAGNAVPLMPNATYAASR